mgnify:CR=1 FL=1
MSATHTIKTISAWIAAHAGTHQSKTYLTNTTRGKIMPKYMVTITSSNVTKHIIEAKDQEEAEEKMWDIDAYEDPHLEYELDPEWEVEEMGE